jgi:hypothetical protein
MRNVDLESATYTDACGAFGNDETRLDDGSVTLSGGSASIPIETNVTYDVALEAVGYGDADGDGDEDAVVFLSCTFNGQKQTSGGLIRVYRATPDGGIEQIGSTRTFGVPTYELYETSTSDATSASGLSITVDLVVFADGDASCCPSSAVRETWTFNGSAFDKTGSTPPRSTRLRLIQKRRTEPRRRSSQGFVELR